ncbi:hypothetical protein BsWGS_24799 [Bradybaena similaris]
MLKDEQGSTEPEHNNNTVYGSGRKSVYLWEGYADELSPTTFDTFHGISIKDVALGDGHSLYLTEDGQVYVCGLNNVGQLGLGLLDLAAVEEPIKLEGFLDFVTEIACGQHHSAIITEPGQVFCWGLSTDGQCGTGSLGVVASPTQVVVEVGPELCQHGVPKPTSPEVITKVACGAKHTLAVSSVGEIWTWGCGPQLGLRDVKQTSVPRRIDTLQGHTAVAICCGNTHSMALVLKGDKARSSSPRKSKGKAEAVAENQDLNIYRCSLCNKEMFTVTDTNDMCIIDKLHVCNVADSIQALDATIIEDLSSSTSSEALRRSLTVSPEKEIYDLLRRSATISPEKETNDAVRKSLTVSPEKESGEVLRRSATVSSEKEPSETIDRSLSMSPEKQLQMGSDNNRLCGNKDIDQQKERFPEYNSLLNDSSQLDTTDYDSSILVIPAELSFGEEVTNEEVDKQNYSDASGSLRGNSSLENSSVTISEADRDVVQQLDPPTLGDKDALTSLLTNRNHIQDCLKVTADEHGVSDEGKQEGSRLCLDLLDQVQNEAEEVPTVERREVLSVEADGQVWRRRSVSEDKEAVEVSSQQSPPGSHLKSLDLSGAREYLQRQFEDEQEPAGSLVEEEKHLTIAEKSAVDIEASQNDKSPLPYSDVFSHTYSMLAQVRLMTSKALNNIQAFSMFSSANEVVEGESTPDSQPQFELSSLPKGTTIQTKIGKSDDMGPEGRPSVTRSGTFMEWTREMASIDDDPGSLTKDCDQRSLRTIEMQQRKLTRVSFTSKSGSTDTAGSLPHPPVVTATELWVWGDNQQGQLGLGDLVDRSQPTIVKFFVGRHVIKLAAGDNHCLALTANSQVYSWGCNSFGQLGHPAAVHLPTRIKFLRGFMTWDIGAGAAHSVFLGDAADMHPDVLYCGRYPRDTHSSLKKTNCPVSLAKIRQLGWITKVMAGGLRSGCTVLDPGPPESEPLFELAASERTFYNQLIKTTNLLLRPLQKSGFYISANVYPFKPSLQYLVASFGGLTKKVGEGITDLTRCIQNSTALSGSLMLGSHWELMEAFQNYSHAFSDFLAVGGFDYCTKAGSEFFEKIQNSIRDLSEEPDKSVAASSLLLRAMRYPFFRLAEYSQIISKMAALVTSMETKTHLQRVVLDWDGLKINFSSQHKMADTTRVFWETSFHKLTDAMQTPQRRMLRDSKTHPLMVSSGGKFTSRYFVLFNDVLFVQSTGMILYPLETLWIEPGGAVGEQANVITITTPEDKFDVLAPSPADKAEWLVALNSAISKVLTNQKSAPSLHGSGERLTPPLTRHARHTFVKTGPYKDATYNGTWVAGKIHGNGVLTWPDGSVFEGNFKRSLMHGTGTYTLVRNKGKEVQTGTWKDGKLSGLATVHYANGDLYEGYFQDGQRAGHGMYQSGHYKSTYASVYIGEWLNNLKEGYGVQDDILKGEKYMGMWVHDHRQGSGVLVTLDGMYFEGNFVQSKLVGFGLMISDDNTLYEGDFMDITYLSGKGTLTLSTGDKLEGTFSGTLNEGLKVNGMFIKSAASPSLELKSHLHAVNSKYFGRLGVHAHAKWTYIFTHIAALLGQPNLGDGQTREDTYKAWEVVAVMVTAGRSALKVGSGTSPSKLKVQQKALDGLDKIPTHCMSLLNTETVKEISLYLSKAFDCIYHPLGQLMDTLVDVFRASYIGIGAHPRLLHHAIMEMKSYICRLYKVMRILFPALPPKGDPVLVYPPSTMDETPQICVEATHFTEGLEIEDPNMIVLTATGLLHPILLPKIYPALFDLYALYNERSDDLYWQRVAKLNRQSDMGLMVYLGIEQRFWLADDVQQQDKTLKLSTVRDVCYTAAVDTLQQLSTAFCPTDKLKVIEQSFNEITKTVTLALKDDHVWCMDDLFPIFQFVVVRSKIRHLGAEIHMMDDLIEPHLEHGEFGLMFTTLKACYFQIQNEKMPHH